jgi:hypothetical protein
MFQEGTDKALDDLVQRPALPKPVEKPGFWRGALSAPFRGVGAGVAESIAYRAETAGAFGEVSAATGAFSSGGMFSVQTDAERKESEAARNKVLAAGPTMSNEAGNLFRARAKELMPDPDATGTAAHVIAGLTRFGTKAVGYMAGGAGGVVDLGMDEGLTESDRLKQQGVDISTRTQAGTVAGVVAGGSMLAPMSGATAVTRFVKGVAVGEGTMIGQAVAERAILENAGYDKIASTFDPFDPVSLAVGLVPGLLGAKFGHAAPKPIDALKTEADVRRAAALTPDEAARSAAFERSAGNLAELEGAIKAEKDPAKRLLLVDELQTQRKAAHDNFVKDSMRADPDLEPAARVRQVVDALDESRLTPDSDLRGMAAHQEAIETAHEQIARGEPVTLPPDIAMVMERRAQSLSEFMAQSKVIDEVGKPQAVFHGTPAAFDNFSHGADAYYFTSDAGLASRYAVERQTVGERMSAEPDAGPNVRPSYLALENPLVVDGAGKNYRDVTMAAIERARSEGRDGVIVRNVVDEPSGAAGKPTDAFVAFHPDQVRSAFDPLPRTAAAFDELRATREQAQNPPHAKAADSNTTSPTERGSPGAGGGGMEPNTSAVRGAPASGTQGEVANPGAAAISHASAEVAALNPDLLVQLDGMDAPMRVADLMEKVKKEAADEAQIAKLVQVAAECALTA